MVRQFSEPFGQNLQDDYKKTKNHSLFLKNQNVSDVVAQHAYNPSQFTGHCSEIDACDQDHNLGYSFGEYVQDDLWKSH